MTTLFRIRSSKTGEFSTGGSYPCFKKNGKVWKRSCDVSLHLSHVAPDALKTYRDHDAQIVEYEYVEKSTQSIDTRVAEIENRKHQKVLEQQARRDEWEKSLRKRQYEELKKEFEG